MIPQADLVAYVRSVHARTAEVAALLDDGRLSWRPRPGEFTAAELALHIVATRRMTSGAISGAGWHYAAIEAGSHDAEAVRRVLEESSAAALATLEAADLSVAVASLAGTAVPGWRLVVSSLIEHEVHHRSQLCEYLGAMGVAPPALYGLHTEDLPA